MKKIYTGFMGLMFIFTLVTLFSTDASAQKWGRGYNRMQVDSLIQNVEHRTDFFVDQLDDMLDESRLNGTDFEDAMNRRARQLENATDDLRKKFNRHGSWQETYVEVQRCLNIATELNFAMPGGNNRSALKQNWSRVRTELNILAGIYGLPKMAIR